MQNWHSGWGRGALQVPSLIFLHLNKQHDLDVRVLAILNVYFYYMDKGILLATKTLVEPICHYIRTQVVGISFRMSRSRDASGISINSNSRLFCCCFFQNGRRVFSFLSEVERRRHLHFCEQQENVNLLVNAYFLFENNFFHCYKILNEIYCCRIYFCQLHSKCLVSWQQHCFFWGGGGGEGGNTKCLKNICS